MNKADELIKKILAYNTEPKYWYDINNEVQTFLKGDYSEKEKDKIRKNWALLEMLCMLADGYKCEQNKENK